PAQQRAPRGCRRFHRGRDRCPQGEHHRAMSDHPAWCEPEGCTANDRPAPSLRRAHRGAIARVEVEKASVTTMLIQDPGGDPKVVVTAAGWAHSRMVELGTAGIHQLIGNLADHLRAIRPDVTIPPTEWVETNSNPGGAVRR